MENYLLITELNHILKQVIKSKRDSIENIYLYWEGDFVATSQSVDMEQIKSQRDIGVVSIGGITSSSWSKPMIRIYDIYNNEYNFRLPYSCFLNESKNKSNKIIKKILKSLKENDNAKIYDFQNL